MEQQLKVTMNICLFGADVFLKFNIVDYKNFRENYF
jgi:hypothetical protein